MLRHKTLDCNDVAHVKTVFLSVILFDNYNSSYEILLCSRFAVIDLTKDIAAVRQLCQQLRVPDLKYLREYGLGNDNELTLDKLSDCLQMHKDGLDNSILELLGRVFEGPQRTTVINVAFILDRTFDVWLRKNHFPGDIEEILTKWRFAIYTSMLLELGAFKVDSNRHKEVLEALVDLLETVSGDSFGWSPVPERSKHFLLEQLDSMTCLLLEKADLDLGITDKANGVWLAYRAKESAKFSKVSQRLVSLESQQCWKRFSYWCAQTYVDHVFSKCKLPASVQNFLDMYWVAAVAESLKCDDGINVYFDLGVDKLTQAIMLTFCIQGDELFKYADTLVDELKQRLIDLDIAFEEKVFQAIEQSLVALLKQEFTHDFVKYASLPTDASIAEQFAHYDLSGLLRKRNNGRVKVADFGLEINEWYVLSNDWHSSSNMILLAYFKYAGAYLFANHLGMKVALFSKGEMENLIRSNSIKPLKKGETFVEVFSSCLKGLSRVAESQQKARLAAAEKAKQEAERLLEEQRKAELEAELRAKEIEKRAIAEQKEKDAQLRAEKEAKALKRIHQLSIGAWVALTIDDLSERYKLVVKIGASGKFIFVDKLGIKKKEFKEAQLADLVISNKVEFLSDGAEFEDSLQRVVSRLRIAK